MKSFPSDETRLRDLNDRLWLLPDEVLMLLLVVTVFFTV